jgi:short-subunit dehydrogenase
MAGTTVVRQPDKSPLPVLITGASGGIGADLTRIFARQGHPLALVARSGPALDALAREVANQGSPAPLTCALDLSSAEAPGILAGFLASKSFAPGILVNNAGFGLNGHVTELDRADQINLLDLNIRALTALTLQFLPQIVENRGKILNVASTAAFLPGPGMAVYYASKAYVLSLSQSLSQELKASGVTVTALCPGPTATGFFQRAGGKPSKLKALSMMSSVDVAEAGYRGLMAGRRIVVPGFANKLITAAAPFVPKSILLPLIARIQLKT